MQKLAEEAEIAKQKAIQEAAQILAAEQVKKQREEDEKKRQEEEKMKLLSAQ